MAALDSFSDPVWEAIKAHLVANWTATPLAYEDTYFDQSGNSDAWVFVELTRVVYGQESIGAETQAANRWDEEGNLWLHLNASVGTDVGKVHGASKALANLFRGLTLISGRLEFLDADIDAGETDADGRWFRQSVSVSWRWLEAS